jgi:hypothetical protein
MKSRKSPKVALLSLAVLVSVAFAPLASASVVGHLSVGICGGGQVVVSAALINWEIGTPSACLTVGGGTHLNSVGDGTLLSSSPAGLINDLPASGGNVPPSGGIFGFMRFTSPGISMYFDLAGVGGFGPGSGVSCSTNPGLNNSCSIPGSAFLLTQTSTGTSVTLLAQGTIFDTGDSTTGPWSGAFTTQINGQSPLDIYNTITTPGGSIQSTFSGEFDVGVPEPVSMALIGGGLIALAAIKRRKRV